VVSPHPDDELLGCGGTLLRRRSEGVEIGWLIVTSISENYGWAINKVRSRDKEIQQVANGLGIRSENLFRLNFPTTLLDTIPMGKIVDEVSGVFKNFQPEEILVPYRGDVHTDHRIVFDVARACSKWFRYPSVRRVLAYETISETDFSLSSNQVFKPNYYSDIGMWIDKKIELLKIYSSELNDFPFPRSEKAIKALAHLRGSQAGFKAAEAFELLLERS
jgi:LmbE family N-acetylglucosaminyl deacetylase